MSATEIAFSPLIAPQMIWALSILGLLFIAFSAWRGLKGWFLRGLCLVGLLLALANPALVRENREALNDIALVISDDSLSMELDNRTRAQQNALASLRNAAQNDDTLDLVEITGGRTEDGTRLGGVLREGLGQVPRDRLASVVILSDGQVHDAPLNADEFGLNVPVHHIVTGDRNAGDRRLTISEAPRFGLIGEELSFTIRVEDETAAEGTANVTMSVDGGEEIVSRVRIGQNVSVRTRLNNRGPNTVQIEVEPGDNELSLINNRAAVSVTGVRDRMRVLLVTGEPHNGARAWRNLLKSDPSVDLVHFTILRPLDKDNSVPGDELALIEFPVFELFQLRLQEFDLVIFDRYKRRGILRGLYFDNIARYVENGGALLVTTGPPFAGGASVARSPLASVLPAAPTGEIAEGEMVPLISEIGERHPVTAPMRNGQANWGPWYRYIGARPLSGETVLEAPNGDPLLSLARAGAGRAAILLSDQTWLWARDHKGGGPHDELFRRVAHWLMSEPELDEERLSAVIANGMLRATRTSLSATAPTLEIEWPSGRTETRDMVETDPGRFQAETPAEELGLVRLRSGDLTGVVASGPLNPLEYMDLRPNRDGLETLTDDTGGGTLSRSGDDPAPQVRRVSTQSRAWGSDWIGVQRREAYRVLGSERTPLAPALLVLAILMGLLAGAWHREGQ
jgi:hypothetical protein